MTYRSVISVIAILLGGVLEAAAAPVSAPPAVPARTQVLDLTQTTDLDHLLDQLADRRVIFVGEHHDRYEDHLEQFAIIRGLRARGKQVAIGMEYFQQPFQADIDAYIAGVIDEEQFLRRTEYFQRWSYDYRLYRPLLQDARAHETPVIALNLEAELTRKIAEVGIAGLNRHERERLPQTIDRSDQAYRQRLHRIFEMHPAMQKRDFEHFLDVQLTWDEGMAARAAEYVRAHPQQTLVVLAGEGHLQYGSGIPQRLQRRIRVPAAIVLDGKGLALEPGIADYLLFPPEVELPHAALLGVLLDGDGLTVQGFGEHSGGQKAGMMIGDTIRSIDGQALSDYADLRIVLLDHHSGDRVPVEVVRKTAQGRTQTLTFEVELH